mgnify:FL=1
MDNLTHSLAGAVLGQMGLKTKTGLAMPTLIIAANIPDIDAVATLLGGHTHLAIRRGITHGPIALVVLPLILWAIMLWFDRWQERRGKRPEKRLPVHKGWLLALAYIGCLSHPAMDWLNVYGIRLLEPFSSQWFYGDTLFIIDIWIWLGLGFAVLFSLWRERRKKSWRWPAIAACLLFLIYVGDNRMRTKLTPITYAINEKVIPNEQNGFHTPPRYARSKLIASPPPFFSWQREIILGDKNNWRLIAPGEIPAPRFAEPITDNRCQWPDVEAIRKSNKDLDAFLFWSRAPFAERASDGSVLIRDARFTDPLVGDRFTVKLADVRCDELE